MSLLSLLRQLTHQLSKREINQKVSFCWTDLYVCVEQVSINFNICGAEGAAHHMFGATSKKKTSLLQKKCPAVVLKSLL